MASWNLIDSTVLTKVKRAVLAKYSKAYVTSQESTRDNAVFPTVTVREISSREVGADLRGDNINAVDTTFQIDVLTNESQAQADAIMMIALSEIKKMRFRIIAMPIPMREGDIFRSTMRCRRVVGSGDTL